MDVVLSCQKVGKRFGSRVLFQELDLDVKSGERFFILGPSGCGKTTLLRIISGLDPDHEGEIRINGQSVAGQGAFLPPHKRGIGLVFQDSALWPHLTVEKHLTYAPGQKKRKDWLEYLLELTALQDRRKDYPSALSGGECQRLSIARALSNQPALLLLDEPMRHLDRNLAVEIRETMVEILERVESTSIFVTHDQEEALSMAHRILLMGKKGWVQMGPPDEMYHRPETPWAAAFFGTVNRFRISCDREGKVDTALGRFSTGRAPGTPCELILRAEQVEAAAEEPGIPAVVTRRTFLGDAFQVLCQVGDVSVAAHARAVGPEVGSRVFLRIRGKPMVFVS